MQKTHKTHKTHCFLNTAILVASITAAPLALAQTDITGTWVQAAEPAGAISGSSDSGHDQKSFTQSYTADRDVQWRLEVTDQKGRAFHAKWCSQSNCEPVVGAFNGKNSVLMADDDGTFMGELVNGMLEICYVEPGKDFKIVGCQTLKRQ